MSALTVKAPLFMMVIVSVPPPFARTPEIRMETGVTVTVPGVELENVPLNRVWAPDIMFRVPPVYVKLLPLPVNAAVFQLIVPLVATPLTPVNAVVMSSDAPLVTVPTIEAVPAPDVPKPSKSVILSASAKLGIARANSANKTTRLMTCSSKIDPFN